MKDPPVWRILLAAVFIVVLWAAVSLLTGLGAHLAWNVVRFGWRLV